MTLTAGSKRQSLLVAGDDDEMFMTKKYQRYTKTTTEQNLIVRSDKSEAEVTNDKRLCPSLCTIEANCMYTVSQKMRQQCMSKLLLIVVGACLSRNNKNLAIANRSRVSCAQNTSRASP